MIGCGTALFNMLITPFKMLLYKVKLDAKFYCGYNILIFRSLNLKKMQEKKKILFWKNQQLFEICWKHIA